MDVVDRLAKMIRIGARFVAELSLENVPFTPVHAADEQRGTATHRLHEARKRIASLPNREVKMVGHDRERDQPRICSTQRVSNDADDCIA